MRATQEDGRGSDSGLFGHELGLSTQNAFRRLTIDQDSDVFLIHLSVEFDLEVKAGTGEKSRRINGVNGRGRIDTAGVYKRQPQSGRCRQNRTFVHENTILVANKPLHQKTFVCQKQRKKLPDNGLTEGPLRKTFSLFHDNHGF